MPNFFARKTAARLGTLNPGKRVTDAEAVYEGAGHAFCNKEPYLTAATEALRAHTSNVYGLTDKVPVVSEYVLTLNNDPVRGVGYE
jgi:hypothetical protein